MQNQEIQTKKTIYESIFGVKAYSLIGPLFYLVIGGICLACCSFLFAIGIYFPQVARDFGLLRSDIGFPFFGILLLLFFSGASVGLFLGSIGFIWGLLKR